MAREVTTALSSMSERLILQFLEAFNFKSEIIILKRAMLSQIYPLPFVSIFPALIWCSLIIWATAIDLGVPHRFVPVSLWLVGLRNALSLRGLVQKPMQFGIHLMKQQSLNDGDLTRSVQILLIVTEALRHLSPPYCVLTFPSTVT